MRTKRTAAAALVAGAATLIGAAAAPADVMHPRLAARLSGMGEHGVVDLDSQASKGRLCWAFSVPLRGITGATIRDAGGMKVAELGMRFRAKGCGAVPKQVLETIEAKPGAYRVWVDTRAHPGELRGTLFAGMAAPMHGR